MVSKAVLLLQLGVFAGGAVHGGLFRGQLISWCVSEFVPCMSERAGESREHSPCRMVRRKEPLRSVDTVPQVGDLLLDAEAGHDAVAVSARLRRRGRRLSRGLGVWRGAMGHARLPGRRWSRGGCARLCLGCVSAMSRLYLGCVSGIQPVRLGCHLCSQPLRLRLGRGFCSQPLRLRRLGCRPVNL